MTIQIPENPRQIAERLRTEVKNRLPETAPFTDRTYIDAEIVAYSGTVFQVYNTIKLLELILFADTATGASLKRLASIYGISLNAATQSQGFCTVDGVPGSVIPSDTLLSTTPGLGYRTQEEAVITTTLIAFASFIFNPEIITFTTSQNHNLATGVQVTISGFNEAPFNGLFTVTVIDEFNFSYSIPNETTAPTGTPSVSGDIAILNIKSEDFGADTNLIGGTPLSLGTVLAGVNSTVYVQATEVVGGADIETDDSLRDRLLFRLRNPITPFGVSNVIEAAKQEPGVTRVFIQESIGAVSLTFTLDNNTDNIPSGQVVENVRQRILEIRTMGLPVERVTVTAPIPVVSNFVFNVFVPDTPSMRTAVEENIRDFLRTRTTLGVNIKQREIDCAIESTIDLVNGLPLEDFNLLTPGGGIALTTNEIAVLGTVTYDL